MDFELSEAERAFEAELERFLEERRSPEVMDRHPEQLPQTVDTPAKRAFMAELAARGWLGMSWPREYGGAQRPGSYDFVLTQALSRFGAPHPGEGRGSGRRPVLRAENKKHTPPSRPSISGGETVCAIGYSEPGSGSDAAS